MACARADKAVRRIKPTSVVNSEWRIMEDLREWTVRPRQPRRNHCRSVDASPSGLKGSAPLVLSAGVCPRGQERLKPYPLESKSANGQVPSGAMLELIAARSPAG